MQTLTKRELEKLLQPGSHALNVEDFDDIEELDRLADRVCGVSTHEHRLLSSPFELCGMVFYPLTVAKSIWYVEKIHEWGIPPYIQDAFFFWILTLPNTAESMDKFSTFKDADKNMRRVAKRLHCSQAEIENICRRCCGVYEENKGNKADKNTASVYGGLIACLIREYGQSADYWLYEATVDQINSLYDQMVARIVAEESAQNHGGVAKAPSVTPKLRALKEFNDKLREIKEKWGIE